MNLSELHPVVLKLFKSRNYSTKDIADFLSWDLKELPDLADMLDLGKAAKRIVQAIQNNEQIGIHGDYDVDGTTSCALLYHFFKMLQKDVVITQPNRSLEGYGLHISSIDQALQKNVKVLITVDCGITNNDSAKYAKEKNIDLIITDHHTDASEQMPEAFAIINPNRRDDQSVLKSLAGVGVAFTLANAIKKYLEESGTKTPSIYPLLQFVAIGTICDLAKLTPLNLKLVRHGLLQMKSSTYPGIQVFLTPEERTVKFIPSEKLSFNIGPMINSKGRLDHADKALAMLTTDSSSEARDLYYHLEICNRERKLIQSEVYEKAKMQIINSISDEHKISIVYSPEWHEGVIGIVASKLVEDFKVPAIVFTNADTDGVIKASIRSAGTLNIFELLERHKDLYIKFGGHKAAAGLSMQKNKLPDFIYKMNKEISLIPRIERTNDESAYDIMIDAKDITPSLMRDLEHLEPFGQGNAKPIFKMKAKLSGYELLKDVHVRWNIEDVNNSKIKLKGISFNYLNSWGKLSPADLFKIQKGQEDGLYFYFSLALNRFNGNEYIQLMVERIIPV